MNDESNRSVSIASGIIGSIALLADVLGIFLFIREMVISDQSVTTGELLTRLIIIIAIFIFGTALIAFARTSLSNLDKITAFFAWAYVILSALLLSGIAYQFILYGNYGLNEYIGLMVIAALIAILGAIVGGIANYNTKSFAIPFMLAALFQVILWVYVFISGNISQFDWTFIGNVVLFAYTSLFILAFLLGDWAGWSNQLQFKFILVGALVLVVFLGIILVASGLSWGGALIAGPLIIIGVVAWMSS